MRKCHACLYVDGDASSLEVINISQNKLLVSAIQQIASNSTNSNNLTSRYYEEEFTLRVSGCDLAVILTVAGVSCGVVFTRKLLPDKYLKGREFI